MDRPYANGKTYQEIYDSFWKELVENSDGTLNKDKVMRELADYKVMIGEMAKLYSDVTNGKASHPMTQASEIRAVFDDEIQQQYDKGWKDGYEDGLKA